MIRTYSELIKLPTFEERFRYLKLGDKVGEETFGFDRYLNQKFYHLPEWRKIRREVIVRDNGCDLGIEDREIPEGLRIIVHHINPMAIQDISNKAEWILNPEFLITTYKRTHNAIHYGDESILLPSNAIVRRQYDTCPWR